MYCAMRSRKVWVDAAIPLHFCCFLTDRLLLLLYQDNQVTVLDIDSLDGHEVCRSILPSNSLIINCKRISTNTCAALPSERDVLILMRITPQLSMEYRVISIAAGLVNSPSSIVQMMVFDRLHFALVEQDYLSRSMQIVVMSRKDSEQLQGQVSSMVRLMEQGNNSLEVVRPLQGTLEIACFKQQQHPEVAWRVSLLSVVRPEEEKAIDLHAFLTEGHTIIDVMMAEANEYLLFARMQLVGEERTEVWRCHLHGGQSNFVQSCQLLINYPFPHGLSNILSVNHRMGTFLTCSSAPHCINGEMYDNQLHLASIATGATLEILSCTLKAYDITPNQQTIVDYSQEVNSMERIGIHLRVLLPKPILYHFMLRNSPLLTQEHLTPSFQAMILQLL